MKEVLLFGTLLAAGLLSGCGLVGLNSLDTADTSSAAFCIVGSGPPMTGGGTITGAKTNKEFKGQVNVSKDCDLQILAE